VKDEDPVARRFERQVRFAPFGPAGQARLGKARVALVGCGALGGQLAQQLVRAGVGTLVVVDRDVVCETNLPRQVLFDAHHAALGMPKVDAARESLERIGGPTRLVTHAAHLDAGNADELLRGATLVLDGTDNLETRYLVNDWCVSGAVPWVYGAVVGGEGRVLAVRPGAGPCLRCVFPDPPPAGALATCDTAGVLGPAVGLVASLQAGLALRLIADPDTPPPAELYDVDAWRPALRTVAATRDPGCPCCGARTFPFLGDERRASVVFCGRNAVQLAGSGSADLDTLAARVGTLARDLRRARGLVRFEVDDGPEKRYRVTLFADGRALVEGTEDAARARAVYDRYVGA
jgi:adenylyltransferase/sulfurtransferase